MRFTHGSSKDINDNNLDVFDYIIYNNGKMSLSHIDNGNDGEGIGINAFIGDDDVAKGNASLYTSDKSSFVYILDVDVKEDDLMHLRSPDEIPIADLALAIEAFMDELREKENCNKQKFDNIIDYFESRFDDMTIFDVNIELKNSDINIELDEWGDPSSFSDFYSWKEQADEQYNMNDPCSRIIEEGGPEVIAQYAINKAENLWETIKYIGQTLAIQMHSDGVHKYNKTYQTAINSTLSDYNLTATYVDNNNFAILFDTDKINIIEKINLNLEIKPTKKLKL